MEDIFLTKVSIINNRKRIRTAWAMKVRTITIPTPTESQIVLCYPVQVDSEVN